MTETAFFTYAGATLVVETQVTGVPASGDPPVLLLHGIGMGRTVFAGLIEHLGDSTAADRIGSAAITVDLPGYGEAPEPSRVLTMERTADLVAACLRSRGTGPVVVIGHSMGTQVGVELAARHPELVDRLVLIGPTVNPRERTAPRQLMRLAQDLAVESPRVIVIGAREYLRAGPNLRRKFRAMLAHRPEMTYPGVRAPTLVLRGENDYVSSRVWCRSVANALPDGRLAEVPGHGHETMIRDAAPAAALIRRFLRQAIPPR